MNVLSQCVDAMVMLFAYVVNFTGACCVGISHVYMLNNVGERNPPWCTSVLNCRCVSECSVSFASFDVVCHKFENGAGDVCLG